MKKNMFLIFFAEKKSINYIKKYKVKMGKKRYNNFIEQKIQK